MKNKEYVIGLDYGSDSVRAILVDTTNGQVLASSVFEYPRWKAGKYCDASINQFRQHPLDYLEGLESTIRDIVQQGGPTVAAKVIGLSVDTTGSTPIAVSREGTPLSLLPEFAENPNAMFILWKDHTAVAEANEINQLSRTWGGTDFTKYEGGIYSSEWFWAKLLHVIRSDRSIHEAAYSWVEHCDWIPALLTGMTDPLKTKRSRCAAGHKAMWHEAFGGLPSEDFLVKLDPLLAGLRDRLYSQTYTADIPVGNLSAEWAKKLGLNQQVVVGVGTFDAHAGALGGEIEAYTLSKVMGTSTCDMLVAPMAEAGEKLVSGICGQVDGSIVPGMLGLEAGQSAFGDIYAWFKKVLMWPAMEFIHNSAQIDDTTKSNLVEEISEGIVARLNEAAAKIPIGESGIVALDWMNGRRTPDANQSLKGAMMGLNLAADAPRIFKALVEATCFGSKKIVDRFIEEGIPIHKVVALGGVAKKSPYVMQVMADVLNMPIQVATSEQTPALGAAMLAAVASDIYSDTEKAKKSMGNGFDAEYYPIAENVKKYQPLYDQYLAFGTFVETQTNNNQVK